MNETMQENCTFSFKTQQVHKLKQAISSLCDPQFNPEGLGRIEIDDKGLQITVFNVESRVLGNLRLKSSKCDEFIYNKPFSPRMVNLNRIFRYLALAVDDDIVTIYHVLESDELSFIFGNNPPTEFSVKLLEPIAEFRKFPVVTVPCGAVIPSQHLRQMVPLMFQEEKPRNVSVKMTEMKVSITVGDKEWRYEGDGIKSIKGWKNGEEFSRCFQWPHRELLVYTSYLSKVFLLCCLDDPLDNIMFRFTVTETSDLTYITSKSNLKNNPICSFRFQVFPASPLKQALNSLTDCSFGQDSGQGMIRVSSSCFYIIVRNSETEIIGILQLVASGLVNFRCKKPLEGKMVNVNEIANNMSLARDNDLVTVHHVDGSNEINFESVNLEMLKIGPDGVKTSAVELLEMDDEFREWPCNISVACKAVVPSEHLREMIPLMTRKKRPQIVSLEILYGFVSISIGRKSWDYAYNEQLLEQKHRVLFEWPHPETLQQASFLADWFSISVLTDPPNSIMFLFKVYNAGYLAYVKKMLMVLPALKGRQLLDALAIPN